AGARFAGVGLLQKRPDQDDEIRPADPAGRQARHLAERADDGEVPAGDEEVLLRSDEVQELSGAARHQIPDGSLPVARIFHRGRMNRGPILPVAFALVSAFCGTTPAQVRSTRTVRFATGKQGSGFYS